MGDWSPNRTGPFGKFWGIVEAARCRAPSALRPQEGMRLEKRSWRGRKAKGEEAPIREGKEGLKLGGSKRRIRQQHRERKSATAMAKQRTEFPRIRTKTPITIRRKRQKNAGG